MTDQDLETRMRETLDRHGLFAIDWKLAEGYVEAENAEGGRYNVYLDGTAEALHDWND